jgi:Beta-glucosidase-related glycosidases
MKKHISITTVVLLLTASMLFAQGVAEQSAFQPELAVRSKKIITVDGLKFKDLNGNGVLDAYEDWRLSSDERADNLISLMTVEEKAGMMMIDTLNSDVGGRVSSTGNNYINQQYMHRFIFRNTVTDNPDNSTLNSRSGAQITAYEAAQFTNTVQQMCEETRLGIPALFKSNARNHYEHDARAGINVSAGAFSAWPKEAGLAATRDMDLIAEFATIMRAEWNSIGLRGMYGYMADLATEPRWYRIHETFSESSDLNAEIVTTLIQNLQGKPITNDSIVLTMKHFPGGGPQLGGLDPHYPYGREQSYTGGAFADHWKPFKAAIDAGLTSIMPYYGIPVGMQDVYKPADDVEYNKEIGVGMAFNKGILTDLLRGELGFVGNVNSDTGIIGSRAWGLEEYDEAQQIAIAVNAGTDVLSGYHNVNTVLNVIGKDSITSPVNSYAPNGVSEERVNEACHRLLVEFFEMGLFENPYVDPNLAATTVGRIDFVEKAYEAQKKSVVMLENKSLLPLSSPKEVVLYTLGASADAAKEAGFVVKDGDNGESYEGADKALIRVKITTKVATAYKEDGTPWTYANGSGVTTMFGGAIVSEVDHLALSDMANDTTWVITPSLAQIQEVMNALGSENVIIGINFRQPYVIDEDCGIRDAGALFATFGVSDKALLEIITGRFNPSGKLPFALASNAEAILTQDPDLPGYEEKDTLYPFGYGLSF